MFFNAHDLDRLIFPIINYISEECEAVSFGSSMLHLRSQEVEQRGIIGWIMNRSFLTMYVNHVTSDAACEESPYSSSVMCDVGLRVWTRMIVERQTQLLYCIKTRTDCTQIHTNNSRVENACNIFGANLLWPHFKWSHSMWKTVPRVNDLAELWFVFMDCLSAGWLVHPLLCSYTETTIGWMKFDSNHWLFVRWRSH